MQEYYKLKKKSNIDQKTVYDVAIKFNGNVTVSDIYTNSNLTIEQIEFILADLSSKDYVKAYMDEKSSVISYKFPDISPVNSTNIVVSTGIDKLILRLKYGNSNDKPIEYLEKAILQTAQEFNGKLTMSRIVEYTGLGVDDALDIISILCAKGICKREFDSNSSNMEFYFPDLIEANFNKDDQTETVNSFSDIGKNLSKKALKKIRQNTDKMLIKSKANKFKRRYYSSLALDSFAPGLGHLIDKRWNSGDLLIFSILPLILTGGLSFIPSVALLRHQDSSYYSISARDKNRKVTRTNKKSLAYVLLYSFLYYKLIGLQGLTYYYLYLFNFLGF